MGEHVKKVPEHKPTILRQVNGVVKCAECNGRVHGANKSPVTYEITSNGMTVFGWEGDLHHYRRKPHTGGWVRERGWERKARRRANSQRSMRERFEQAGRDAEAAARAAAELAPVLSEAN